MKTLGKRVARAAVVFGMIAGCGGGGGGAFDAPVANPPDAPRPDASPPDATPPDGRVATVGAYVMDTVSVPTTTSETQQYGLDIDIDQPDGDPSIDNQLGAVFAALASQGLDTQAAVNASIDQGLALNLIFHDTVAGTLQTFTGENPDPPACNGGGDTVCRHHLDGHGSFDVAAGPGGTMPAVTVGVTTTGGPGTANLNLVVLGGAPAGLTLIGARFHGTIDATGISNAVLAGAVPSAQIQSVLIPAIGAAVRASITTECTGAPPPGCGCTSGGVGATFISLFDADHDCAVPDAEIMNNTLIQALLAPDVNIDGVDGISLGIGITAVPAVFTVP